MNEARECVYERDRESEEEAEMREQQVKRGRRFPILLPRSSNQESISRSRERETDRQTECAERR